MLEVVHSSGSGSKQAKSPFSSLWEASEILFFQNETTPHKEGVSKPFSQVKIKLLDHPIGITHCPLAPTEDIVLPEEYKAELRSLHDQAATFDFAEAQQRVELGRSSSRFFGLRLESCEDCGLRVMWIETYFK